MSDTEKIERPESVGERLHKARLKRKVTIEEVYKETKIHPKVIAALEEDRYEEFMSPIYSKAFLKTYCRYLEIDANKIITDYDKAVRETQRPPLAVKADAQKVLSPGPDWRSYMELGRKWLLPVGAGVLGIVLGVIVLTATLKAVAKAKAILSTPSKTAKTEAPAEPSLKKTLSIPQNEQLALIVKAKDNVWLKVKSDGKTVFQNVLKKGSVEAYKANDKFHLWTGKGEYIELVLNGNQLGSPGKGVIRNIILTRDGLKVENK